MIPAVLFACLTGSLPTVTSAQQPTVETEPLGEGMWLLRGGPGGNILVLDREEGVVLVDAQSANVTEQVADAIARISTRPVRWVFSSHYHEDHIAGNVRFRAVGATIFGHANLARRARVDTVIDELEWHREAADPLALPQVSIAADTVVALSGVSLEVLAFDNAHTDGDLAFFLASFNVLHTGDIVEVDAYPFIDWWGGGSLDGTIQAVGRLIALTDAETSVVPGHGHVVDRGYLVEYRRMLETVRTRVTDAIDRGSALEQVMDAGYTAEFDAGRGGRSAGRRFVGILYLGLSRR